MKTPEELKKKIQDFIKAANVQGIVYTKDGGVIYLESVLMDFIRFTGLNEDQLTPFLEFLLDKEYCDSDVYSELPTAIDRYLHPELRDK